MPMNMRHNLVDGRFFSLLSRFTLSRRVAVGLTALAVASGLATYAVMTKRPDDVNTLYFLLNVDLVLLLLLGTVVARQLLRVWAERKRGKAGSRLQARFVLVFSFLTVTPAILMAIFSAVFLYFGVQAWFNDRVSTAVKESLQVAHAYLEEHQKVMRADVLAMANDLNRQALYLLENPTVFAQAVDTQTMLRNLSEAIVFTSDGSVVAKSRLSFALELDTVDELLLRQASEGEVVILTGDNSDRLRALVKLDRFLDTYLYVGRMIDVGVLAHVRNTEHAVREYTTLEGRSAQLQISLTILFIVVALLLMMAAVWFGLVFSRQLVAPISALIEAAERVRAGDLGARVQEAGDHDEIDILARAFNRMASQIEAVLSGASSGVIGLDREGRVTLANAKAQEILQIEGKASFIGKRLLGTLPMIAPTLANALTDPDRSAQLQTEYAIAEGQPKRTLLIRITAEQGGAGGAVVTIDDITALVSAQRKSVWADVARRIAHEIKNPLTPIQLSAERLRRKYLPQIKDDPETFEKCTETIIRQVGDIGHMVGEFSAFARMPEPTKKKEDIVRICQDALILQKQAHSDIDFSFEYSQPVIATVDRSQLTQVITNLLQNAIDSVRERQQAIPGPGAITVNVEKRGRNVILSVNDNGRGLPDKDRDKLMEPYVTTRGRGTGLGLAIVKKILEDHEGSVSLEDMSDGGARALVVFPLESDEQK